MARFDWLRPTHLISLRRLSVNRQYTKIEGGLNIPEEEIASEGLIQCLLGIARRSKLGHGLRYISDSANPATTLDLQNWQEQR